MTPPETNETAMAHPQTRRAGEEPEGRRTAGPDPAIAVPVLRQQHWRNFLSQAQGNRRRRGRGGRGNRSNRSRAAEFQARVDEDVEDRSTFWARSNARLGFSSQGNGGSSRRPRQAVEMGCTVCGASVLVERMPKNRYEVRCTDCRSALGGLLQGEEGDIADEMLRAQRSGRGKGRHEGLPAFTEEDRAALAEMRARKELGNGQVGNRRRRGNETRRRRRPQGDQPSRAKDGGGNGGNGNGGGNANGNANGKEGGRRRRRRRRRSGGGQSND